MANYLYVVMPSDKIAEITKLVGCNFDETAVFSPTHSVFAWSRDGEAVDPWNVFVGFAVDHNSCEIQFGASGKERFLRHCEGCYFQAVGVEGKLEISTDIFAQMPMFYYKDSKRLIVSDSLLLIVEAMKTCGIAVEFDEEALLARAWINSISEQLLSTDTPIKDLKFSPPGTDIKVVGAEEGISLRITTKPHRDLFSEGGDDYRSELRSVAVRTASILRTLSSMDGSLVAVGLSGGQDSRAVVAAALMSCDQASLRINSNVNMAADLCVAENIAQEFGFELNTFLAGCTKHSLDAMAYWFTHNAGVYDALYTREKIFHRPLIFDIGGHGAEIYKGNYGWRSMSSVVEQVPIAAREAFESQTRKGLTTCGIDFDDPISAEWHYLGYRNALHSSRSTMFNLNGVRPLLQRGIVALSRMGMDCVKLPIASDLLIVTNPKLAGIGFDKPSKNLTPDYIRERLKVLGGELQDSEIKTYSVKGSMRSQTSFSQSEKVLDLCARNGMTGPLDVHNIARLSKIVKERIPSRLFTIYAAFVEEFLNGPKVIGGPEWRRAGKSLQFLVT